MNEPTRCPDPDVLITLLYDDEGDDAERAALDAHVRVCPGCAEAFALLSRTRRTLGAWRVPLASLDVALQPSRPPVWRQVLPWAGMAAAAVLTLAAAAGLAGLDVRYDAEGFVLRTGWQAATAAPDAGITRPLPAARPATVPADPRTAWVTRAAQGEPPWRADFDLLATQLRADLDAHARASEARLVQAAASAVAGASRATTPVALDEDRLMRRIATQIEQSEVRQQQNLALRVAELGREFQLRRQADLVQFEQGLQRVEQQRRDLIRRVAVAQAPQP